MFLTVTAAVIASIVGYGVIKEALQPRLIRDCANMSCAQLGHVLMMLGYETADVFALNDLSHRLGHGDARVIVHEELMGAFPDQWDAVCAVCPGELVDDLFEIMAQFKSGELDRDLLAMYTDILMRETERALGV